MLFEHLMELASLVLHFSASVFIIKHLLYKISKYQNIFILNIYQVHCYLI
jgi:hypothetical protein